MVRLRRASAWWKSQKYTADDGQRDAESKSCRCPRRVVQDPRPRLSSMVWAAAEAHSEVFGQAKRLRATLAACAQHTIVRLYCEDRATTTAR